MVGWGEHSERQQKEKDSEIYKEIQRQEREEGREKDDGQQKERRRRVAWYIAHSVYVPTLFGIWSVFVPSITNEKNGGKRATDIETAQTQWETEARLSETVKTTKKKEYLVS